MKRTISFLLALLCGLTLAACRQKTDTEKDPKAAPSAKSSASVQAAAAPSGAAAEKQEPAKKSGAGEKKPEAQPGGSGQAPTATLAPSKNTTVVQDAEAPKIYWAFDTAYHLKGCKELKGREAQEIPWSAAKEIGLRQCPVCNPPRYEGYIANDEK